jgi:hypothetical protein
VTAIADFVAHPRTFLRNNIVRARFQMPDNATHVRPFKLTRKPGLGTRLADGAQIPIYEIEPVIGQELTIFQRNGTSRDRDYLNAYWCPYDPGQMHAIVVADAANFMFTTNMDGCSFGVGHAAPDGSRRVAHTNMWGVVPNSRGAQNMMLQVAGYDRIIINPNEYMQTPLVPTALNGEIKITTFGVRNPASGHWSFWYQQYRLLNGDNTSVVLVDVVHAKS